MVKPVIMYSNYANGAPENSHQHKKKKDDMDDAKSTLMKETPHGNSKVHPENNVKAKHFNTTEYQETDEDKEFLDMIDLVEVERTFLDNSLEKLEELSFDSFNFCQVLPGHGIQYMMFKICQMYNLFDTFHFPLEKLVNFSTEIANGYFMDNPYHN